MYRKIIACATLAALLCSCQTPSYLGNENSPYYVVPAGSRLMLNQELQIPPDQVAVYVQNGRVLPNIEVLHNMPFCKFELERLSASARNVQPDDMLITHSAQERTRGVTSLTPSTRVQLASADSEVPSLESFSTRMDLRSDKQPQVFRLTCAQWGQPGLDRHVTIAEMRQTLAGLFTLRLPHQ